MKSPSLRLYGIGFAIAAVCTVAWIGWRAYAMYMTPIVERTSVVRFPRLGNVEQLVDTLVASGAVTDTTRLRQAMKRLSYRYRSGQFELEAGMSAKELVEHLKFGPQKEARLVLTNGRQLNAVATKATRFVEADSAELHQALLDSTWLDSVGLSPQTAMSLAIPNTYYVYWDASGAELRDRLWKEAQRFWDKNNRRHLADSLGLSPTEVYTLASIVESETNNVPEKPTIAGVYLNRLKRGIKLDADPTVVFANGNFSLRRVLYRHLEIDSPYNTYRYAGLPPGPISMASISSIDAVLHPQQHDYLFFVTKGDGSGTHAFAKTMTGHSRNIAAFKRTLRRRGIRR